MPGFWSPWAWWNKGAAGALLPGTETRAETAKRILAGGISLKWTERGIFLGQVENPQFMACKLKKVGDSSQISWFPCSGATTRWNIRIACGERPGTGKWLKLHDIKKVHHSKMLCVCVNPIRDLPWLGRVCSIFCADFGDGWFWGLPYLNGNVTFLPWQNVSMGLRCR